jgi:hypothetical protein
VRRVLADVGITVPDIILAEEHDNVNTIYQLLRLQFKLDYARSQGCDFPDEQDQPPVETAVVDDSFSMNNTSNHHHPSDDLLEDDSKGHFRMFNKPLRARSGSKASQHTFSIDDSDHTN